MVKNINVYLDDKEYNSLKDLKGNKSWKALLLDMRFDFEHGLRCGNCIHYDCPDEDICNLDNDMMSMECKEFKPWRCEEVAEK